MTSITFFALAGLAGCGSSAPSREAARDQATTVTCDRFASCNLIGSMQGQTYPTIEACQLAWRAEWDKRWLAASCEGKIDSAAYDMCLNAIRGTACNIFDFFNTLGKCDAMNVCHAAGDGGAG
jgi:hypothetical protein